MKTFIVATAISVILASAGAPAVAASAHNSQAGAYGDSQNSTDSTPSSPRVKHAAKHKRTR